MLRNIIISAGAVIGLAACDAETMEAISQGISQAAYETQYGYGSPYGSGYGSSYGSNYGYGGGYGYGSPYTPGGFGSGYWPVPNYGYGNWVGRFGCRSTGTFYACDSNGDGYVDMWGDTADGSYSSQYSRVNGRGEGFSWDRDCDCWERDRSLDGEYKGPRDGKYRRDRDRRDRDRYDD